eukprot:CAMPEP_0194029650 /NCGR_PEP_ID=MMETSP0009_2-20130614/3325_1 /TAXON_ID=210454 /ORGANISM="Grammatophora oceanica, Strain CCMP 410" /LENGTH=189 /DNA_ID=CAMNT_0038669379 /DNA_START=66 /DNA_END=635 /DNA_ORIENTATION=+
MLTSTSFALLRRAAVSTSVSRNASVVLGLTSMGSGSAVALCDDGSPWTDLVKTDRNGNFDMNGTMDSVAKAMGDTAQGAIDSGIPTQTSYGFVMGYCSGFAMKKVGKAAAGVLGLGFMALQTLSYSGYIQVDHSRLKKDVEGFMDLNKDGKVDAGDAELAKEKLMSVIGFNMPAGGGFGVGFLAGLRSG